MARLWSFLALVAGVSCALAAHPAAAQEPYPARTVKIVVPAAPGSTTDTLARLVADQLAQKWGKATIVENIPDVLVVRKVLPAATLQDLIDYAKSNPRKLSYASQGVGSTAHLSAAQLEVLAGIKMVHVPYRGAQPALTDVVAGHVDMFFDTLATSVPLYRDHKVK